MQFAVIGLDGTDKDAVSRRKAVREDHLKMGDKLLADGNLLYGAALLHDNGDMKGSIYIVRFDTEAEFQEWFKQEPYVTGDVWREITVHKSSTRNPWQFNRDEQWFKDNE